MRRVFYGIVVLLFIIVLIPDVSALTRIEINEIKDQLSAVQTKITNITIDIETQKQSVNDKETEIDLLKEELRTAKQNADGGWDSLQNIQETESAIIAKEKEFAAAKEQLNSLLDTKSSFERKVIKYKAQLKSDDSFIAPQPIEKTSTNSTEIIPTNSTEITPTEIIQEEKPNPVFLNLNNTGFKKNIGIHIASCHSEQCPTYEDLMYLDTSNQEISGVLNEDGTRDKSYLQESWRWYDADTQSRIFVDPPLGMNSKITMITLYPNFVNYFQQGDLVQKYDYVKSNTVNANFTDGTGIDQDITKAVSSYDFQETARVIYHDVYVDKCKNATVNAYKWAEVLIPVIEYIQSGCVDLQIDVREVIPAIKTEIDITTSPHYQYNLWLENAKNMCKLKC